MAIVLRFLLVAAAAALGAWSWGWVGGIAAGGGASALNWLMWFAEGRPRIDDEETRRVLRAYTLLGVGLAAVVYGAAAVALFFVLPSLLLSPWAGIPIGVALSAVAAVGLKQGWITLGDD